MFEDVLLDALSVVPRRAITTSPGRPPRSPPSRAACWSWSLACCPPMPPEKSRRPAPRPPGNRVSARRVDVGGSPVRARAATAQDAGQSAAGRPGRPGWPGARTDGTRVRRSSVAPAEAGNGRRPRRRTGGGEKIAPVAPGRSEGRRDGRRGSRPSRRGLAGDHRRCATPLEVAWQRLPRPGATWRRSARMRLRSDSAMNHRLTVGRGYRGHPRLGL